MAQEGNQGLSALAGACAALIAGGCHEAGSTPDIWYFNLLYFTGPIRDAEA